MNELLAYCGTYCGACPVYWATREFDKTKQWRMREAIAKASSRRYAVEVTADDITGCDGCRSKGDRVFCGCRECPVRKCAEGKGLANCAPCPKYPCGDLLAQFAWDRTAEDRLEMLRSLAERD
jgi:hypothetical protein